ncbi:MAG: HEPN domain-containing protein [Candidatus Aenigmarchaeota archaeon]|nr:HEPN domain-containing protein [Candidatus Aenigmarchaeota archaeon]
MGDEKTYLELSRLFLKKAKEDLEVAEILLREKKYADSVYHSQQAAEKSGKAILLINKIFVAEHRISRFLPKKIGKKVIEYVKDLERHWVKPRYPFIGRDLIWDPTVEYTKELAEESLKKAKFVFEKIVKIVKKEGVEV